MNRAETVPRSSCGCFWSSFLCCKVIVVVFEEDNRKFSLSTMGRKSKRDSRWNTRLEPTKIYDSPFSPVLSSRSSAKRLEKLLQNPLRFTQATDLSLQHEPVSFFPSNSLILNLEHCDMSANSSSNSNVFLLPCRGLGTEF